MNCLRLLVLANATAVSGLFPSRALPALLAACGTGPTTVDGLVAALERQPDGEVPARIFRAHADRRPILVPIGDGALVLDLDRRQIRSLQHYCPLLATATHPLHPAVTATATRSTLPGSPATPAADATPRGNPSPLPPTPDWPTDLPTAGSVPVTPAGLRVPPDWDLIDHCFV